ncbi:5-(carboxyamino)imidazole ribonucleotide synthase [Rhodovulum sp. DZ06]|uniref:5-(carboxyamino)imidazole ribonucleotide synthase n=1 Tax=Rhodovulum sp. DZ06 TaxID=3425126 RepID=UPI003D3548BB
MSDEILGPGSTIGILGGGQLGRMTALAAARLGIRTRVYEPSAEPPAGQVCDAVQGGWDDEAALAAFADSVDVVTYEFENVPVAAAEIIAARKPLRPGAAALRAAQDRAEEKRFLEGAGLKVAPWAEVNSLEDLEAAIAKLGTPSILKTRRFGYDGKGQVRIKDPSEAAAAWAEIKEAPAVLEGFVPFKTEISVIAARGLTGEVVCYDPGENVHTDGILSTTTVPAAIPGGLRTDAVLAAGRILNALDYVGVIGVELFVAPTGLVVNEIAPRVHNTGHWTQDGCAVDQFEQHVRAICGWKLGDGARHADAVMENLIGDDAHRWAEIAAEPGARLHLYGKAEARPGRKMGHVNRIKPKS